MSFHTEQKGHEGGCSAVDAKYLLNLAQDTSPTGRYVLANAVTNFFEHDELNTMERHLIVEIMMGLINRAELDLREALAEKLAALPNVPAEVVIFLANDKISVARPLLQCSPVLNDADLVYIISSKSAEYWQSIARREQLSPLVVRRLVDTGDIETAGHIIDNPRIVMHRNTISRLIKISLKAEELQPSLLRRPEIDADLATELYSCVSQVLRREISQKFNISPALIDAAMDSLVEELNQEAKGLQRVTCEMATLAKRFRERGEITPTLMIKTLRRGQISFFTALFAEQLGLAPDAVVRLIKKDAGKYFVMACRSIGMMKSEFASIYLLSRSVRTGDKVVNQSELAEALKYYDTVKDFDVQRIRKDWAKNPEAI
jgi:uncharacterized protein (DUF2336 family)